MNLRSRFHMNMKIDIADVKLEWLNRRTLVLISIFAHAANKSDGKIIDLRAGDVLNQISSLAKSSNNEELLSIYKRIKREIKLSLAPENASARDAEDIVKASTLEENKVTNKRQLPH